jgi:hypothetical protein
MIAKNSAASHVHQCATGLQPGHTCHTDQFGTRSCCKERAQLMKRRRHQWLLATNSAALLGTHASHTKGLLTVLGHPLAVKWTACKAGCLVHQLAMSTHTATKKCTAEGRQCPGTHQ